MPPKPMVLVVDDTDSVRKLLVADLSKDDRFRVDQAATGQEALEKAVTPECAVVVLDMMLPDTDGLQFIDQLRVKRPNPPAIIAITGASETLVP
ncbi:MAG TPA: response regulator, partial [Thermoanaerobaculia bacterium]